jgi:predicted kinase
MAAAVAARTHSALVEIRCEAPAAVTAARLAERDGMATISDADQRIAAAMSQRAQPWPAATTVRTDQPPQRCLDAAVALVGQALSLRSG